MLRTILEDFRAHGSDCTRPGFQALTIYRVGVWNRRLPSKALRAPLAAATRALHVLARNFYGIEIPFSAQIGRRVVFEHQHGIVVHGNSVIGDDCILRQGVTLGIRRMDQVSEAPVLGKGVSVGAGAKILGNVKIGDYANVGANAVVLKDVPTCAVAVGIPAVCL
jgi:serine O-acetyltransferase